MPPGAPAATASIDWDDVVDRVYGIPAAAAPRAASISPSRMRQRLECHRGDGDRQRARLAEERRRRIDPRDVDQDPRPEPPPTPGRDVLVEADLVPRAARDVVEGGWLHDRASQRLEVGQA